MQLCNHKWYSFYYKINTHTYAMFLILPANRELSLRLQINFSTFVEISWCAHFEDVCDHTKMSRRVFVLNFFTVFWKDEVTTFQMQLCNHKWYISYYKINTHTHAMFCSTYLILAPNWELSFLLQISFSTLDKISDMPLLNKCVTTLKCHAGFYCLSSLLYSYCILFFFLQSLSAALPDCFSSVLALVSGDPVGGPPLFLLISF